MTNRRNFLSSLFDMLNSSNIDYAVMRNYEELPYSTGGSDLDIWVAEEDCRRFFDITLKIVSEYNGKLVSYIWKRSEPKICLLGPDFGLQIDVYKGLIPSKDYVFFTGDVIKSHIIYYNGVKVISPNWSALEAFLKEILNTGGCDKKDKYYVDAAKALKIISYEELKEGLPMFSADFIKQLMKVSEEPKSKQLIDFLYFQGRRELTQRIKGSKYDKIKKFCRLFHRPGYMITILGTDGSGKSAIYHGIYEHLENAFHKKLYYCHLRPHLLPDIAVLFGKRDRSEIREVCENPHAGKSSGFIMSIVRLMYYLQDYMWGYLLKIWPFISTQSAVFVMDRYYYDYYIDQTRSKINLPYWVIRLFDFFVPAPDIILCLGGEPEKIFERKPETSLEEVKRQTVELKKFCEQRSNAFWVDTTENDLDTSIRLTLDGIAKLMSKRFEYVKEL